MTAAWRRYGGRVSGMLNPDQIIGSSCSRQDPALCLQSR
jgi:hypothetical protein